MKETIIRGKRISFDETTNQTYRWKEYKTKDAGWKLVNLKRPDCGYYKIMINGKKYRLHRVVYKCFNPDWNIDDTGKNNIIDHKDGNKINNTITNLRIVSAQQNCQNNLFRNFKGYAFNKRMGKYNAYIRVDNVLRSLGYFDNPEDAHECYLKAKKIYHFN